MRRTAGVLAFLVWVAVQATAQSALPRFDGGECLVNGEWAARVRRDCGWLVVPESRDHASAHTVRLAVEIFRAQEPNGSPPLVLLHGGPGGPGGIRMFSAGVAASALVRHRDVVVYDQRAAGFSEPKLCPAYESVADAAYNLRDGPERDRMLREARRACVAELDAKGIDRLAYNTAANAADLVDLRRTLGYASWDIRGASYGARLAQEAIVRDGPAIRAVVLPSPAARGFSHQAEQPLSTQRAFERLFSECRAQPACRAAFPAVEQDFYAVYAELARAPLPLAIQLPDGRSETVSFDGDRLVAAIRERMVQGGDLGRVPLLLHELRAGDRLRAAREMLGKGAPPALLAGRALREIVNCYDQYGTAARKTLRSINARVRSPFRRAVTRDCEEWLPRFAEASARTPVRSDVPALILTGRFDDRTPAEHARRIAATLGRSYLVEFPDKGHDPRTDACQEEIVSQFLEDPTRRPDTSCNAKSPSTRFATAWEAPAPQTAP
jgi:pimeloyl-ACP methyl ester carboxylesterase